MRLVDPKLREVDYPKILHTNLRKLAFEYSFNNVDEMLRPFGAMFIKTIKSEKQGITIAQLDQLAKYLEIEPLDLLRDQGNDISKPLDFTMYNRKRSLLRSFTNTLKRLMETGELTKSNMKTLFGNNWERALSNSIYDNSVRIGTLKTLTYRTMRSLEFYFKRS